MIDGVAISTSIIKGHLIGDGMLLMTADTLLAPNDRQDVVLMLKLLHAVSLLEKAIENDRPTFQSSRRVLRLLGRVYAHLLQAYMNIDLSLNDQLVHLSSAAHLILAIYNRDKGNFIPVQTCFDIQCMIKTIYFCVAKTQVDNPSGEFYIILVGSGGLEKVFGKVRTMVGNNTNADQLQLANRIDGAVKCVNILERHPEWGGQARRLTTKPLSSNVDEITSKYDHISPKSWRGNVKVQGVHLGGAWMAGRRGADKDLSEAQILSPFSRMEDEGGYTVMCPFGKSKMLLVDGISAGEQHEEEEESDEPPPSHTPASTVTTNSAVPFSDAVITADGPGVDASLDPDVDDVAGLAEAANFVPNAPNIPHSAWVEIDGKKVHKSTVMRLYSNPFSVSNSKDRLKRVRGYSQYHEDPSRSINASFNPPSNRLEEADNEIMVQDPAVMLVKCNKKTFLAVFQILGIRIDSKDVLTLPSQYLHEPNVRFTGQVMRLALVSTAHQSEEPDWEWNGTFEPRSVIPNIEGRWVEAINPVVQRAVRGVGNTSGQDTYTFSSADLRDLAAVIYERIGDDVARLPTSSS